MTLKIAAGLKLDPDYIAAGTIAVLAKRGAGKTYAARVMAEEMWKAGVPFVALDPMGAWWGLRSSSDGKHPGIPVPVFGGEHGDAPLERTGGALMADLVVDERLSMILDLKGLGSRTAERQFALDFLDRLYRRNHELVHLFIDEADLFAPQRPAPGDRQLLGATENIVRRGRPVGIGTTLITQRPAVLNKDVLTQLDGLIAMRITGYTDREAIDDWVKGHADQAEAAKVKQSLASLNTGEAWVWIPELGVLQRTQVRRLDTFDSSATRTRADRRTAPKSVADIDMAVIQKRMAATIERAKADDPKELRREVQRLRAELAQRPTEPVAREVHVEVEVPMLTDDDFARFEQYRKALESLAEEWSFSLGELAKRLNNLRRGSGPLPQAAQPSTPAPQPQRPRTQPPTREVEDGFRSTSAQQRILNALASLAAIGVPAPSKTQLALFAAASPKSSGYTNNLGSLRSAGLIAYPAPGTVALTDAGRSVADAGNAPHTVEELHAYVRSLVGPARSRIIDQLISVYPDPLAKGELAKRAGVSATSSGYTNNLGSLRSLGLIDYPEPGYVVATSVLFLGG